MNKLERLIKEKKCPLCNGKVTLSDVCLSGGELWLFMNCSSCEACISVVSKDPKLSIYKEEKSRSLDFQD
ncbi:MAG TPA: hypothetical protein ENF65_01510 [Euryarchaeota archaeon]|nr:MAG: hypothetical protein DRN46_01970 [Thermococci archaeon]HDI10404.1 hypothetical protein [Euryarchaeota archaeon]